MIRVVAHTSSDNKRFICGFSEGTVVSSVKSPEDGPELLKHVHSEEFGTGLLMGGTNSKTILCVHLTCQGKLCECQKYALRFLESKSQETPEDFGRKAKECVTFPFLAVLMDAAATAAVTFFSEIDFEISSLIQSSFEVRDCLFVHINESTFPNPLSQPDFFDACDYYDTAQSTVDQLSLNFNMWPKVSGLGLTYVSSQDQSMFLMSNPTECCNFEKYPDLSRPKGPITAFNFFSKSCRKAVIDELSDKNLSNNELNKILGQKWKDMSFRDRDPFHVQAANDRNRYLEEIAKFNEQVARRERTTMGNTMQVGKPLTAYNHFVHQEKQFIMGLNLTDAQTRMGKHGGDRWNEMDKSEKALYLVLREADAAEFI